MEFCKRYGHSQDHGMARQTSGQQIPPKGTTRQKISKTSPSKREIHGFLTDRITRFPCQNMKLCKLGTGRRVSRRQGTKHPQKGRPDRSCPPTFTRAADSLSHAKVSRGQDLPRAARPLSHAKGPRGARPELPTHFRMRKSPGGKTCPGLPAHFRMRKAPGGQDQSCRLTFACESLPGGKTCPGLPAHFRVRKSPGGQDQSCRLTFACESLPRGFNLPVS